jgi:hypothetical protein
VRRAVAIAIAATAVLLVSAAAPAGALARDAPVRLTIVTLPKLVGIRFALDGRTFVTGKSGYARIKTTPGTHLLQALDTFVRRPSTRSTFLRWSDGRFTRTRTIRIAGNTRLDVGYRQSVRVSFRFADPAGHPVVGRVTRLTLSNTLGGQASFQPERPQWLPAINITRGFDGLAQTLVKYSISQALVDGSNVVNKAQQRFYPALTRQVTARLLLFSARVSVRDFLLGTSAGSRLQLVYPDGSRATYGLHGKELRLLSLPRGTYQVDVGGGGFVPTVSVALSRNQVLKVRVISYLDMFLFLLMALAAVSVLALVARPYLRLRIRSLGTGRQPTPDDLEPIKPLSGARKELIVRYMVPAPALPRTARGVQWRPDRAAHGITVGRAEVGAVQRLRMLPRRMGAATIDRLQRFQDSRRRLRRPLQLPAAHPQPLREALSAERIDLVHVYMGETIAPVNEAVPPKAAPQVEAARATPKIDERRTSVLIARLRAALIGFHDRLRKGVHRLYAILTAAWLAAGRMSRETAAQSARRASRAGEAARRFRLRDRGRVLTGADGSSRRTTPAAAPQLGPAPPVPTVRLPELEEAAAPASETVVAPPPDRSVPPRSEPSIAHPAEPEKDQAAPRPQRTRPSAGKETQPRAKEKTATPAKQKASRSGTAKPKAKTVAPAKRRATRSATKPKTKTATKATEQAAPPGETSATPAAAENAAAAEALPEDPPNAKATPPKRRKVSSTDVGTPAPAKPKTKKAAKATEQAAAPRPASPTSAAANGEANIDELAHLGPELAAAVEALREDLREARTATTMKGSRKSSAKAR